mmetsp:Transcript_21429/g.35469  ORF Transcript_21429/g.35469 Transcript_21429/m.35469 type:complete len:108 (-) Transcript_21429:966-1289(-)
MFPQLPPLVPKPNAAQRQEKEVHSWNGGFFADILKSSDSSERLERTLESNQINDELDGLLLYLSEAIDYPFEAGCLEKTRRRISSSQRRSVRGGFRERSSHETSEPE